MAPTAKQLGVMRGVATAAALIAITTVFSLYSTIAPPRDRMQLWLKWNTPKGVCLFAHVANIGNYRFMSPADIDGAGLTSGTAEVKLMQALLQNTLEQVVLALVVHGAFAALAPDGWLVLVPVYSVLFVVGRIFFAFGYRGGAPGRALGFALTLLPTVFMMLASAVWLLRDPW